MLKRKKTELLREAQAHTISTFTKVNDRIFMLDYENDYFLEPFLKKGAGSSGEILAYACRTQKLKKGALKWKNASFACTTFNAQNERGQQILGRNFDYRDAPCCVCWCHPRNGYQSISITDTNFMLYGSKWHKAFSSDDRQQLLLAPYLLMDGMNEAGLAIDVVELKSKATRQKTGKKPISTTLVMRGVLDTCSTCEEAVALFSRYDMHNAFFCDYHYHIVDRSGKSVIIEYVNNEMRLFYPDEPEKDDAAEKNAFPFQYMVNFYLSEDGDNAKGFGYTRWGYLKDAMHGNKGRMTEQEAMDLLEKCRLSYRKQYTKHIGHDVTSLWSAVYNTEEQTVTLCAGMDYSQKFRFRIPEPLRVEVL